MMPPPEKHLYVKTLLDNNRMTATAEWSERGYEGDLSAVILDLYIVSLP
jgi:hypothetical protein